MTYNRKLATLILLVVAMCLTLMPTRAHAQCDATTIVGSYGYELSVFFAPSAPPRVGGFFPTSAFAPGAFAGRIVFTTAPPSISGSRVGNVGGVPKTSTFTGSYSVNSDCTGTVNQVLSDGETREYEIAIVQGGAEIDFADTTSSPLQIVGGGVAKRAPATCDATTIAGSYGFGFNLFFTTPPIQPKVPLHLDAFEPDALAGRIVFDPGTATTPPSISGFRAGNTGGRPVSSTFIGTYSVNSDCTGTVSQVFPQTGIAQIREHEIAIVQGGAEIEFANTVTSPLQPGPIFQIVGSGVAKKQD